MADLSGIGHAHDGSGEAGAVMTDMPNPDATREALDGKFARVEMRDVNREIIANLEGTD